MSWVKWAKRAVLPVLFLVAAVAPLVYHATGLQVRRRLTHIESLIDQQSGVARLGLPKTYHIASLSFLSEGLLIYSRRYPAEQERVKALFGKIIASALNGKNGYCSIRSSSGWGEENLLISHMGIILLSYELSTGDSHYGAVLDGIVSHLRDRLKNAPRRNIRSYNRTTSIWPADNALMYQLIFDWDRLRGGETDRNLYDSWLTYMDQHGSDSLGLHLSELTANESYSAVPRGCALSWSGAYMAAFAPEKAKLFWRTYKRHMKVPLLFWTGFREYPRDRTCGVDGDSGPIILGVGGGATGLALTGAGANGDFLTFYQLNNTMNLIEIAVAAAKLFGKPEADRMVNGLLPSCIKFKGEMQMLH